MNNRRRKCCCINNNRQCFNKNMLETSCPKIEPENEYNTGCNCGFDDDYTDENMFPNNPMYGQSYVPIQYMDETFKPCPGLKNGTIFPELVSPYMPCDSMRDIELIKNMNTIGEGCNADGRR